MHTWTRHSRKRARIAWITCLAILFNMLVPLVSHAMNALAPAPIVMDMEVCTAIGMETMPIALSPAPAPEGQGGSSADRSSGKLDKILHHCGYCVAHAAAHALPPAIGAAMTAGAIGDVYPPLY